MIPVPGPAGAQHDPVDPVRERFLEAMRTMAATVTVVTASGHDGPAGLTATAVCSLSVDPPTMLACVGRTSTLGAALHTADHFAINVLGPQHEDLAQTFAGSTGVRGRDRFTTGGWRLHPAGPPVLDDAVTTIVCRLRHRDEHETHSVVIGDVVEVATPEPRGGDGIPTPLMYHHRRYVTVVDQPLPES